MVAIESTPEFVSGVYKKMQAALEELRQRLDRPMGLADKVVLSHLNDTSAEGLNPGHSYLMLRPDRVALQDVLGQTVMLQFMQTGMTRTAVPTTVPTAVPTMAVAPCSCWRAVTTSTGHPATARSWGASARAWTG